MNNSLDKELREIEAQLTSLNPAKMPDDMISRMEQAMISWENNLPEEEKIVQFGDSELTKNPHVTAKTGSMPIWGAAAAIALVAAVTGVFMTGSDMPQSSEIAGGSEATSNSPAPVTEVSPLHTTTPSPEHSRNIIHASNEGFTYSDNKEEAFKVLRIEYTERTITHDSNGNSVVTEKPCLEHVLVPVPVH